MKKLITTVLALASFTSFCQTQNTFEIETLTKPEKFLYQTSSKDVFKFLKADIEKNSQLPDSIVTFGEHPFLTGILTAYKEHRPFVISPDIMWLLISQGFARHISNNSETFRKDIVAFKNKKNLNIISNDIQIGNPNSNWEAVFPQFTSQINDYTGNKLTSVLTADFTTTTPTTRIVSEITVMETVKDYFNYKVVLIGCGIPKITIEGTVEDWQKVLDKTKYIAKYNLTWWTSELEPVLKQIIETKKGNFKKDFWMNMVKAHTEKKYGSPTTIDGWIVKFFPYTKEGKKRELKPIAKINDLASELVKVPFVLEDVQHKKSYKMEFWAGFVGLSQNKDDYTLKPEIAWAINNKNTFDPKKSEFRYQKDIDDLSISNIETIPNDIYSLQKIDYLHLSFLNKVHIPDELAKITIDNLELKGQISSEEEQRIRKLLPNTKLKINGEMR
ncbi:MULTISPECIES: DUF4419 domain-containing protein [unclassified Arcicella]|uniref:DUF4419 domain-containing protein n=1 Tax=unclassified Arcicella TaxID=2644986 RepID=UPI00285941EF|nr:MULTISPECIES: DUF4419 domain-containing protein [unclassified Arcicella]MDR6561150.1 hypothetical protein [Arcicella sp. BE51]MDR6811034.1 hypothetical protein [Arcicella sp. BE140]MDR6822384.1 hypothetical protein [Arcicella sp. BE139]